MDILVHLSENELKLVEKYAQSKNKTVSNLFRKIILEKIEDDIDLNLYNNAMTEHQKQDTSVSFDEFLQK